MKESIGPLALKCEKAYLEQLNNNSSEKIDLIISAINSGRLPKSEKGRYRIMEMGAGGGDSARKMNQLNKDVDVVLVDFLPEVLKIIRDEKLNNDKSGELEKFEYVSADACKLPFGDETISAINASAIFHEISSYGTSEKGGGKIFGKDAIREALREIHRVLMPDGIFAYRDVLAPVDGLDKNKKVEYYNKAWVKFFEYFLGDFIRNQTCDLYDEKSIKITKKTEALSVEAPVGLHREIQRHYITFRDFLRNKVNNKIGVIILKERWLNKDEGVKELEIEIDRKLSGLAEKLGIKKESSQESYEISSVDFDAFYDKVIEYYFEQIEEGNSEGANFLKAIDQWNGREGGEYYIYSDISEMLFMAVEASLESSKENDDNYVLLPESLCDIKTIPRNYYNKYLSSVIDNPETDGKQLIAFKKVRVSEVDGILDELEDSDLVKSEDIKRIRNLIK